MIDGMMRWYRNRLLGMAMRCQLHFSTRNRVVSTRLRLFLGGKRTAEALKDPRCLVAFLIHARGPEGLRPELVGQLVDRHACFDTPFV